MNRKQFFILLIIVLLIGAAGLFIYRQSNQSWQGGGAAIGQKLLPNLPVNDIAQIEIKSGDGYLTLERQNNLWRVHERGDYPANFTQISELLIKLADLKVAQSQLIGPSQLGRFDLLSPGAGTNRGTSVDFKDQNGKSVGLLLLGKKHMKKPPANAPAGLGDDAWPDGRYVMAGASMSVALISDPLDNLVPKSDLWLNKDFLNVEDPRMIEVRFPNATNSWKLTRASETNDWQLAAAKTGEKLDPSKISGVTSPFSSPSFNDVGPMPAGAASSNTLVTVETFDGFTYRSSIGTKKDDSYPVSFSITANLPASRVPANDEKPADKDKLDKDFQARQKTLADKLAKESAFTNWLYQMPAYGVDEMLKPRQDLLADASTNSVAAPDQK